MTWVSRFVREDDGVDLIEYAFLVGLIAVGCIAGINGFSGSFSAMFGRLNALVNGLIP